MAEEPLSGVSTVIRGIVSLPRLCFASFLRFQRRDYCQDSLQLRGPRHRAGSDLVRYLAPCIAAFGLAWLRPDKGAHAVARRSMGSLVALDCHFLDDDLRKIVRDTFDTDCVFPAFPSNAQGSAVRCLVSVRRCSAVCGLRCDC